MSALFSFYHHEVDPKILKRRIEASLAKATSQQLKQIYGHVRQVMESWLIDNPTGELLSRVRLC